MPWFRRPAAPPPRVFPKGSIRVNDPETRTRLEFLGLTEDDLGTIRGWQEACMAASPAMVDAFYAKIMGESRTRRIIEAHTTIERQRPMLTRYLGSMLTGAVDDAYLGYRRKVGQIHDRIDLESNWFVAMYEVIRRHMLDAVRRAGATPAEYEQFAGAFERLLAVDIAVVVTALTDTRLGRLESIRKEAHDFIAAVTRALDGLAARDLTARIEGAFEGEYERLQSAFNAAMRELADAFREVVSATDQVTDASTQISQASDTLAEGASRQAASLEETSAGLKELTAQASGNATRATEAEQVATEASHAADDGTARMARLADVLAQMKQSADATARIVKTIDEIAFQTNLLALNAAVEAARAGDAGRGFAVVAEEVRSLAGRSAEAARQTAELIQASVANAGESAAVSDEVAKVLGTINQRVRDVRAVMSEIVAASDAQRTGVSQVAQAIEHANGVVQQTAAAAEESSSTAAELASQAAAMRDLVGSFRYGEEARRSVRRVA